MSILESKTAILIINLGTPEFNTPKSIRKYLAEFLSDRRVVDLPPLLWKPILHGVILRFRPNSLSHLYKSIWCQDGSPLWSISKKQQKAIQKEMGDTAHVELAMTYGNQNITKQMNVLQQQGYEKILCFPLFPQYSSSTTAAAIDKVHSLTAKTVHIPNIRWIMNYYQDNNYINCLASSVKKSWDVYGKNDKLVMSFHGVPKRYTRKGDPYEKQCKETAQLLAKKLGLLDNEWICSFQSRFGREEWLTPYTSNTLKELGEKNVSVDIISPAFSCDCIETLEEIEVELKDIFLESGGKKYQYIPALNDNADHIQALSNIINRALTHW
jgi:ferrochelatase